MYRQVKKTRHCWDSLAKMDKTPSPQGSEREIELGSSSGTKVEVPAALGGIQGVETGNPSKNLVGRLLSSSLFISGNPQILSEVKLGLELKNDRTIWLP